MHVYRYMYVTFTSRSYKTFTNNPCHLMASKTQFSSCKLFMVLFVMILIVNPSYSTSRGEKKSLAKHHQGPMDELVYKKPELFLGMLPKGTPHPPSGPSKGHN